MNGPWAMKLGLEHTGRPLCAYMGTTPGQFQCDKPATTHLWMSTPQLGDDLSVTACNDHLAAARAFGTVIDEHAFGDMCGMPGTIWDFEGRRCYLDDSGVEPPARVALAVVS